MPAGDTDSVELWYVAERLADAAREETLRHFRARHLTVESKGEHFDPVTIADRNAESAMRTILGELRPEDGILGEEFEPKLGASGLTWVLDPIDGTRGFISGTPTWGVLIALADDDGPILGLIDQPYIGERFMGGRGRAVLEGPHGSRPLNASGTTSLAEATLFTTFPEVGTFAEAAAFRRVSDEAKLTRYGCDCYAYALLAAGQIDLVIEAGLNAYDIQAPIAVIEAAGGIVSDWEGKPACDGGRALAAATPDLHEAAMELLG
ncbi:MAG: histidinol-phosphatase [Boseongicola sp. SB0664_bin_43]|uniref:Histidinol-phosphatase n=1 Tax=Boseongicola sp. SB0664_bin_43 TaxID=2604844 RepID=A0A6B0XZE8_9RHOB|nr:histidinol-phosphatase [Boseongicola sp. SB0664_bin_43]MYK31541.1 histidinol-phosphatase [Boseongicola sp. SB0670_bin_30]